MSRRSVAHPFPMGIESEYGFHVYDARGLPLDREQALKAMMNQIADSRVAIRDDGSAGFFLENGARIYIDAGAHPEYATPECENPFDVVRHVLAGERIVSELADEMSAARPGSRVVVFKTNVDYQSGNTWGRHESYMHIAEQQLVSDGLIPHLVTRLVYTGAGGFEIRRSGPKFVLSPRVAHLTRVSSSHSTQERGIFHTKNEPLCEDSYHRLHVLCGESQCSQVAAYVGVGATALIVCLIDAGLAPGSDVVLEKPLTAMRTITRDVACRAKVRLQSGRAVTAIEIQRHYLEAVEKQLGNDILPSWAGALCEEWRRLLDLVSQGPEAVASVLDWGIKRVLFEERARRGGGSLDALDGDAELRHELFEVDMRFGELGEHGVFAQLDRAGVLSHRIVSDGGITQAVRTAPAQGRARLRAQELKRLHAEPDSDRYRMSWSYLRDTEDGRVFDLSDPFGERPVAWSEGQQPELPWLSARLRNPLRRGRGEVPF